MEYYIVCINSIEYKCYSLVDIIEKIKLIGNAQYIYHMIIDFHGEHRKISNIITQEIERLILLQKLNIK